MPTKIHVTVRNQHDEIVEFDTTESVLHIDVPEGRYVITVECRGNEPQAQHTAVWSKVH